MGNQDYHQHLGEITEADIDYVLKKDVQYDSSWKKRGGQGAFFTMARPWDRLESIARQAGYDLFQKIADEGLKGPDGSLIACVRDLRRYLLLLEAECFHRTIDDEQVREQVESALRFDLGNIGPQLRKLAGLGEHLPEEPGSPADGGHHDAGMRPPPAPQIERMEDGLRVPSKYPSMPVVDPTSGGVYYNIDRRVAPPEETDHLPRLDTELNHKEWTDLLAEYRGMYVWHEGPSKYILSGMYQEHWGKAA